MAQEARKAERWVPVQMFSLNGETYNRGETVAVNGNFGGPFDLRITELFKVGEKIKLRCLDSEGDGFPLTILDGRIESGHTLRKKTF